MCDLLRGLKAKATSIAQAGDAGGLFNLWERATSDRIAVCPTHKADFDATLNKIESRIDSLSSF